MRELTALERKEIRSFVRRLGIYMKEFHYEHGLINNRMTWYVMSQSFLVIALVSAGQYMNTIPWIIKVIPLVGLLLSCISWISIKSALIVQDELKNRKNDIINKILVVIFDGKTKDQLDADEKYDFDTIIEPWQIRDSIKLIAWIPLWARCIMPKNIYDRIDNIKDRFWIPSGIAPRCIPVVFILFWIGVGLGVVYTPIHHLSAADERGCQQEGRGANQGGVH